MKKVLLAALAAGTLALAFAIPARATPYDFSFTGSDGPGTATFNGIFDVVGGQVVSGSGTLSATDFGLSSDTVDLVTLSTPGVHDLGGGNLSFRFGGGTDLIGDTAFPLDSAGLVFQDITSGLDVGFNIWSNGGNSYTGFLAGNALTPGGPIIYAGYNGTFDAVEDTPTGVPETASIFFLGAFLTGFILLARTRRNNTFNPALAA